MENSSTQPLLLPAAAAVDETHILSTHSFSSSFVDEGGDIPPIAGALHFSKVFTAESKKLWYLAGPAIFTSVCQYSLGAITQTFAGHVSTLDLAAFSIENSVIGGLSLGIMVRNNSKYIYIYFFFLSEIQICYKLRKYERGMIYDLT